MIRYCRYVSGLGEKQINGCPGAAFVFLLFNAKAFFGLFYCLPSCQNPVFTLPEGGNGCLDVKPYLIFHSIKPLFGLALQNALFGYLIISRLFKQRHTQIKPGKIVGLLIIWSIAILIHVYGKCAKRGEEFS